VHGWSFLPPWSVDELEACFVVKAVVGANSVFASANRDLHSDFRAKRGNQSSDLMSLQSSIVSFERAPWL
jgi:hypothetical protein